jgi:small GTP-binding protein
MVGVGVVQLERLLEPIPAGASVLYAAEPGVEAEPFLYQAAHAALAADRDVAYVVTNRAPASVRKAMRELGFHGDSPRLRFVDGFSALMGSASGEDLVVERPNDPAAVAQAIERAARAHPRAVLVVDSLSSIVDNAGVDAFLAHARALTRAFAAFELTAALFTRWPYPGEVEQALEGAFSARVGVRGVEDRIVVSQYFRLERAAWRRKPDLDDRPRLYKVSKPGGVFVYVPKIVVTGPFNAGKSSFVHAVSDSAVSADYAGTTVAMDHGRATMDGLTADVFGTPGQARFDPILRIVAGQAVGVVLVVDSTQPDSFQRAREMLNLTWRHGLPGIVAATKQDLPGALDAHEVARLLDPPPHVKVVSCVGNERESARAVLRELIDQILASAPQEAST